MILVKIVSNNNIKIIHPIDLFNNNNNNKKQESTNPKLIVFLHPKQHLNALTHFSITTIQFLLKPKKIK